MENRAHMEASRGKGAILVDNIRKWTRDNLTVRGRENAIFQKKYDEVLKKLPKDVTDQQMGLIELRIQRLAHSRAIGSMVGDALFAGTAIVGTGMLLNRLADKKPFLSPVQRQSLDRMERRGKKAVDFVKKTAYGGVKLGADITVGVMKAGVDVATYPFRAVGRAGRWLWGLADRGPIFDTTRGADGRVATKTKSILEPTAKDRRFTRWVKNQDQKVMRLHRDMRANWYNTPSALRSKEPPTMDEAIQAYLKKKKVI